MHVCMCVDIHVSTGGSEANPRCLHQSPSIFYVGSESLTWAQSLLVFLISLASLFHGLQSLHSKWLTHFRWAATPARHLHGHWGSDFESSHFYDKCLTHKPCPRRHNFKASLGIYSETLSPNKQNSKQGYGETWPSYTASEHVTRCHWRKQFGSSSDSPAQSEPMASSSVLKNIPKRNVF